MPRNLLNFWCKKKKAIHQHTWAKISIKSEKLITFDEFLQIMKYFYSKLAIGIYIHLNNIVNRLDINTI
ncbi:MAG TPA: hypothetical protein DIS88_04715 [Prevotella sp.]|nr:hypothetical protein [Prevotella sp.]